MANLAVDLSGQLAEAVPNPATPTSVRAAVEARKELFRAERKEEQHMTVAPPAIDASGRVSGDLSPQTRSLRFSPQERKERFKQQRDRRAARAQQPAESVLALSSDGVVREEHPEEAVCAGPDGTIYRAHILASPKRSEYAERKKAMVRALAARRAPDSSGPVLACDKDGKLEQHNDSQEVVVAAADGTIHEAHVKSLSPVHGHREKQKQKALFRSAPKNCPSPVMKAAQHGLIELGMEPWNFWHPEVGLAI